MHPFTGFRILFFLTAVFFDRIAATIFKIVMFRMLDQDNFTDPGTHNICTEYAKIPVHDSWLHRVAVCLDDKHA